MRQRAKELLSDRRLLVPLVFAGLALFPVVDRDAYHLNVVILVLWVAYLGACWNFMCGYSGQFSFGHAAFFGIGAYTSTILWMRYSISPWVGMLVGGALAALFGLLIGAIVFRYGLRGHFLALSTLAFAEILRILLTNADTLIEAVAPNFGELTGGPRGLYLPLADDFTQFTSTSRVPFFYTALIGLGLLMLLTAVVERRRLGYRMVTIREDEEVSQSVGVPVMQVKLTATAISAFATALGGTFYAQYYSYIDPIIAAGPFVSVDIMLPAVVGGLGSLFGPLFGALALQLINEVTRVLMPGVTGASLILFGVLLVVVVILLPRGMISLPDKLRAAWHWRWRRGTAIADDPQTDGTHEVRKVAEVIK